MYLQYVLKILRILDLFLLSLLSEIDNQTRIDSLDLSNNQNRLKVEYMRAINEIPSLTELNLSQIKISIMQSQDNSLVYQFCKLLI